MKKLAWLLYRLTASNISAWALLIPVFGIAAPFATTNDDSSRSIPFSIEQHGENCWLVKPDGSRFFSLGVACVNQGSSPAEWDRANPAYAAWQHYPDSNAWAVATLRRLKAWGFTTAGGWSDFQALRHDQAAQVVFAPVLHIGATAGAPWWDMWDSKVVDRMDQVARDQILPLRDDPRLLGYYTDNEIGWWNAILFKMTLEQPETSGQRQRLLRLLREAYQNDWSALLRDFEPAPIIESWDELERHGMLYVRPGGNGIRVERQFLRILAERYYSLIRDIVRKYDRRAFILGDRYPSFYYPEVVRACAPYVDVISCNLNPMWNDGSFPRYLLETLRELSGKPLIIGEFYMCARENRSGNKNTHGTYPLVETQKERARAFRNTVHRLLRIPYVVGADWFQYYDQPTHGRPDGENFDFGLVDVHDRPYEALTSAAAAIDLMELKSQPASRRLTAAHGIPPAPRDPFANFKPMLALKNWDRERGFVEPASEYALADLYVCWDRQAIYLGLCSQDVVEDVFYRGKTVLMADRAEWIISIPGLPKPIRGRIGSGMEPIFDEPSVRAVNISGINGNVRNIACVELPAALFGKTRFKPGDTIDFGSTFYTHGRAYRVEWSARSFVRRK